MPTFTAFTTLPSKAQAEALGEALENLTPEPYGIGVIEIEDGSGLYEVGGYFTESPDVAGLALLSTMHDAKAFVISELPDTDWVAKVKRELAPVQAGRFYLYGSHDADTVPADSIPLLIEAAMAFGTGHHGTTRGCLEALDRLATRGFKADTVADIGCGTAVLAMAAARIWPVTPIASDIDPVAVDVAEANLAANDMAGRVTCLEATGFDHDQIKSGAPYDLIFANILKGPLIDLAGDLTAHLAPNGYAILSGLLNDQADEVAAAYAAQGLTRVEATQIGDWSTLLLSRPE
ncbi:[LSU ribosomal protein L11P]-lysine N-methyltransferase [Pseudooceanicola nitratireducens]|jgi:ribosomal protein L11 methyltransferase|uniref:Ribosomal protein L11 methyltransferase n=1 Tax=Pseudooceanicola nitratireducens TaxID=517719 RepID=A0A1I1NBI9_9RHOB|nr:50S ribosomal protein L11 methyltransferase [Pseudooceanicola nitratireducens]SEI72188.1 ribosomal protein L11 methyltransferase [Pseudooceanicola nitratireducens]SFC95084.1 [LSU ribosomal protein L11P]-lysine N-methyltransferase [Pseudooceanicola nitratireducens]